MRRTLVTINTKDVCTYIEIFADREGNIHQEIADTWDVIEW